MKRVFAGICVFCLGISCFESEGMQDDGKMCGSFEVVRLEEIDSEGKTVQRAATPDWDVTPVQVCGHDTQFLGYLDSFASIVSSPDLFDNLRCRSADAVVSVDLSSTKLRVIFGVAFDGLTALRIIKFPKTLKAIFSGFNNTGIVSLDFSGTGLEIIGYGTFDGCCKLKALILPVSLKSNGAYFDSKELSYVVLRCADSKAWKCLPPSAFCRSLLVRSEAQTGGSTAALTPLEMPQLHACGETSPLLLRGE
jgi:hypothetical protein